MASRSTRNKVRHQAVSALNDLLKAQEHLVNLYAIADGRSPDIEKYAPTITTTLELVIKATERFIEVL